MRRVIMYFSSLIASFFFLSSSFGVLSAGEALPKVGFVQSGHTASSWPYYAAQEKKFFAKNGVIVEETIIRGATNTTRAVLRGTVPVGRINPDHVITAIEKGAKVKLIAGAMEKIPYNLMVSPEIKSGANLKGKTIGVGSLTGGTTLMLQEVLEKAFNLKQGDYQLLLVAGTSPDRYAALKGGFVKATFMGPPFNIRARKEGFRDLAAWHDHLGPIQFVVTFAHTDYLNSHRDKVVKFLKGFVQGSEWLHDPKNKEEAISLHMKILNSNRETAEEDYQYLIEELQPFSKDGSLNKTGMQKIMELRVKEGIYEGREVPSYTDYVDTSFIEEVQKQLGIK